MSTATATLPIGAGEFRLRIPDDLEFSDARFFKFFQANRDIRIERTAQREIVIEPPKVPK